MKTSIFKLAGASAVTICALASTNASATEAAFGRYTPGVFAAPGVGYVPPAPGVYWQSSTMYYHGSASKNLQIPLGRSIQLGLKSDYVSQTFTGIWVPELELGHNLTLAFSMSLPLQHLRASVDVRRFGISDSDSGLGDIVFGPMLGWRSASGTTFASASLRIFAPTGNYDPNAIANIGTNYWTFSPNFSFTTVNPETGLEFDLTAGIDFNTRNSATDYTSGALAHVDAAVIQHFNKQFGVGIFGSILYQLQDDKGVLADRLDGFKGRSFAIGPMLKYTGGSEANPINASLSWAPEFGVKNRMKGNAFYLNVSGKF
ncbi:SphA family protein [Manganibacter manganicus]|nr:transporter [Pseudaminobacter manganicus]